MKNHMPMIVQSHEMVKKVMKWLKMKWHDYWYKHYIDVYSAA